MGYLGLLNSGEYEFMLKGLLIRNITSQCRGFEIENIVNLVRR